MAFFQVAWGLGGSGGRLGEASHVMCAGLMIVGLVVLAVGIVMLLRSAPKDPFRFKGWLNE